MNFESKKHIRFLKECLLSVNPSEMQVLDSTRLVIAFFAICGLDVLEAIDETLSDTDQKRIVDWIYNLQVYNPFNKTCGFQSCFEEVNNAEIVENPYNEGHIASTYVALCSLIILKDDLKRVRKSEIIQTLKKLQQDNGSFAATISGTESCIRFVYCAVCISFILNDWSGIDLDRMESYIKSIFNYDFAFGAEPMSESQGGTTYCAIASLVLSKRLQNVLDDRQIKKLHKWLLFRQTSGFCGRPGKQSDSCYSFWVGAALQMLDRLEFSNHAENFRFLIETQRDNMNGGFGQRPDNEPDPLHTCLAMCGLSLINQFNNCLVLAEIEPALNVTKKAYDHLLRLQKCEN